ncbi:MAG: FimV/HubP family polar landmark protein [Gammaproteobacteria bacterium]|nr:FimV/HubP family polar landmark protein [Gammaproteobacteria bacterium]
MKLRKVLLSASVAAIPVNVLALGLGNAQLSSALNEPLQARIDLYSVKSSEIEDIKAELASVADFQKAGLEWSSNLSELRFRVNTGPDGTPYISITSRKPVREPFLNFLLEVNWPTGRLLREYTVLLDPPVYADAMKTTVQPTVTAEPARDAVTPPATTAQAPQRAPAQPSAPPSRAGGVVRDGRYGPVQRSETLWSIASAVRPDAGVSVQQAMLALVDANPDAFIDGNVNALKEGQVLRIPARDEMAARSQREALDEVRRQYARWQEQRLGRVPDRAPVAGAGRAGAPAAEVDEDARLELVSPGSGEQGAGAGGADAVRESLMLAEEELDSTQAENAELKSRLAETEALLEDFERLLQLKNENIAELQRRLRAEDQAAVTEEMAAPDAPEEAAVPELAEAEVAETEAGEEGSLEWLLEGAADDTEPAEAIPAPEEAAVAPMEEEAMAPAPEEPPVAAEPPSAVDTETPSKPVAEPSPTPPKRAPILPPPAASEPPGLLDSLPVSPTILGAGLGGILLLLLGGLFLRKKRAAGESHEPEAPKAEVTPVPAPATEEAPPVEDADATAEFAAEETVKDDQTAPEAFNDTLVQQAASRDDDALDEVNVYLAYERYDQAEQLVRKAIAANPEREAYHLKLLEIHHTAKNTEGFRKDATALQALVGAGAPAMAQAMTWWEELAPGTPLFGDTDGVDEGGLESEFEKTLDGEQVAESGSLDDLDFDLSDDDEAQELAEGVAAGDQGGAMDLDFDLGLEGDEEEPVTAERSMEGLDLEFDEDTGPAAEQTAENDGLDLDFDLGEGDEDKSDGGLDFDLSEGDEASGTAGGGLDLDLGEGDEKDAGTSAMELDFDLGEGDDDKAEGGLDFDLGEGGEETTGPSPSPGTAEVEADESTEQLKTPSDDDGMSLDFDLGEVDEAETSTAEQPAGGAKAEAPEESGLDFDLSAGDDAEESGQRDGVPDSERLDTVALDNLDMDLDASTAEDKPVAEDGGVDLDLDIGDGDEAATPAESAEDEEDLDFDFSDFDLPEDDSGAGSPNTTEGAAAEATTEKPEDEDSEIDFDLDLGFDDDDEPAQTLGLGGEMGGEPDEVGTKLDLAQAYIDMGNADGARTILSEVLNEGDETQKTEAQTLLDKLD